MFTVYKGYSREKNIFRSKHILRKARGREGFPQECRAWSREIRRILQEIFREQESCTAQFQVMYSPVRVRTPARPEPRSLQRSRADPLSWAPLLTQASSRHGASSVCSGGGGRCGGTAAAARPLSGSFEPGTDSRRSGEEGGRRG